MRIPKLPIGQKNVVIKRLKTGYADGVRRPSKVKKPVELQAFNPPTICIVLRKAA